MALKGIKNIIYFNTSDMIKGLLIPLLIVLTVSGCKKAAFQRTEISLNGTWDIARTDTLSGIPTVYTAKVPVPGLVDMAKPQVESFDRITNITKNSSIYFNNSRYWYRRTFSIPGKIGDIALLKINKAQYHTWVYVNGKFAGENVYSFTPTLIDIKPFLNESGRENELVIAVGSRNNLPNTVVNGCDYEKIFFIPGIYDNVNLILTGDQPIINVQTVPEIDDNVLRVVAEIGNKSGKSERLSYIIREKVTRSVVAEGDVKQPGKSIKDKEIIISDFTVPIPGARLWSPEDPFLYELELSTGTDSYRTSFGMRSFAASKDSAVLLLNRKPYYMRGTNYCINRFFEDSLRADLPWSRSWVIKLHKALKEMHGNSIRYCIGFPPEMWYEVADSLGILIQDEYPVWGFDMPGKPSKITSSQLAMEYKSWMRERWNHPCVVIWDAQNETRSDTITLAINKVRKLDLSARPWDNGWTSPASESDIAESHMYLLFSIYEKLQKNIQPTTDERLSIFKDLLSKTILPIAGPPDDKKVPLPNPVILNEYAFAWVNRDGSPTTLTDLVYLKLFPEADTPEKRLELYARILGMKTEYWRSHRKAAGVLEFCGLGYSRPYSPRGQTSDHLKDVRNVVYDPYFVKYVRPAFNPVGIMLDFWEEKLKGGTEIKFNVNLVNDTYEKWSGQVKVFFNESEKILTEQKINCDLKPLGTLTTPISFTLPGKPGDYTITGEIEYKGETIKSIRKFRVE